MTLMHVAVSVTAIFGQSIDNLASPTPVPPIPARDAALAVTAMHLPDGLGIGGQSLPDKSDIAT